MIKISKNIDKLIERYYHLIRKFDKDNQFPLMDIYTLVRKQPNYNKSLNP